MLSGSEIQSKTFGQPGTKIFNDFQGVSEIHEILNASPKRAVDHLVRGLHSRNPRARTAIVYGPLIYGKGRGPVNQRSIQIPDLAKVALQHERGVHVGRGLNTWSTIHIADLTNLFVRLIIEASRASSPQIWNDDGVFFAEAGKIVSLTMNVIFEFLLSIVFLSRSPLGTLPGKFQLSLTLRVSSNHPK